MANTHTKIINGDCLKVMKNMADKSVDITFTSPPYNRKRNDKYEHYDDTLDDYFGFLLNVTNELKRITKRHIIINLQTNFYNRKDIYKYIGIFADEIQNIIVWGKTNPLPAGGNKITNAYEIFIVIGDAPLKSNTTYTKNLIVTSVNSNMPKEHRAVMKSEVADWFIENFTKEGDMVFDPFLGIGTTAVSCEKFNRSCIGIEISEIYYNMAVNSVKNLSP